MQTLDASGAVSVAVRAETLAEAREALDRGEAFAVVGIPPDTERDVLKGNTVHIPDLRRCHLSVHLPDRWRTASPSRSIPSPPSLPPAARAPTAAWSRRRSRRTSPADILLQPIFNPVGGYASYIVPAAFVLILQQMLLIGASMLTVVALAQPAGGAFATVLGRGIAHLTIYLPALALYFIVLPRFYGFSTLGHPLQLFALASVFTLATSFMGQAAGAWFKHPETPTLIFLGTSLPQLFLTGFSWPREAIPEPVQAAGYIFPSDFAIDGIVRIDQLGASLWEVARDWRGLWILAHHLFRACGDVRSSRQAEARAWLAGGEASSRLGSSSSRHASADMCLWRPEAASPIVGVVRATEIRMAPEVGGQLAASRSRRATACVRAMSSPSCRRWS